MDFTQAIILSIVEGISEFLPISSTGHLILASRLLNIPQTEFVKTFEISIQFGAILAVVFLYGKRLLIDFKTLKRVIWVFIPTASLGFLLYGVIKSFLLGNLVVTIWALIIGGVLILFLEKHFQTREGNQKITELSLKKSLLLGIIQALSVIPGVSRSGSTIFGGMLLGLSRKEATELSFMLALPLMTAATGYDLLKNYDLISNVNLSVLAVGMVASFLTAVIAIKWLFRYVTDHNFFVFGVYRIIIGLIFILLFLY